MRIGGDEDAEDAVGRTGGWMEKGRREGRGREISEEGEGEERKRRGG